MFLFWDQFWINLTNKLKLNTNINYYFFLKQIKMKTDNIKLIQNKNKYYRIDIKIKLA